MANPISSFLSSLRQSEPDVSKASGQSFALGFVPGRSSSLRQDVLGQPTDANYDLLYAIYRINTDVSGSIDRWIGVVTGNDWQIVATDPEAEPNAKLQKRIDEITAWLKNPNPARRIKFDRLIAETITHLGVTGDAYWHVIRDAKGTPLEITSVHPSTMRVVCDEHGVVAGYVQWVNGKQVATFEAKEVIHFRLPSALNDIYGQSPLERAMEEISQDVKAMAANKSLLDNGFAPAAMLLLDDNADEKSARALQKQMTQAHSGTSKWHKLMALAGVKSVEPWGSSLRDMQFTELRELTTTKVANAYGVPKMYLNQKGSADYATSDVLERDLYNNKGRMLQHLFNEIITEDLIQSFDQSLQFQFNPPQFGDTDKLREDALKLHVADPLALDVNELRETFFGLPRLDEDELEAKRQERQQQFEDNQKPADDKDDERSTDEGQQPDEKETPSKDKAGKSVTKATDDSLEGIAHSREAQLDSLADDLVSPLGQFFAGQEDDFLSRLADDINPSKLAGYISAGASVQDTQLHMLLFGLLVASLNEGASAAQLQIRIALTFDQTNPFIQEYLQNDALQHAKGINQTTRDAIKAQLSEGMKAGESLTDLSKRVQSVFTDAKGYRSTLIARNETAQAYQHANHRALIEAGAESRQWITAGESRVCPICAPLNGVIVPIDEKFPGGLEPSRAHVSCRCTEIGVSKEDDA